MRIVLTFPLALRFACWLENFAMLRLPVGWAKFARANAHRKSAALLALLVLAAPAFGQTGTPALFQQIGQKLVATGVSVTAQQGNAVAISADGTTAIVGAFSDAGLGSASIFTNVAGVWTQQGPKLVGTGATQPGITEQGYSVALSADGNTAVVGGAYDNGRTGGVWVFTRANGVWTQQGGKLLGTGASTKPVAQGWSVAISADGNTLIEGGTYDTGLTGAAWIFTRSNGVWTQQGNKLVGTGASGTAGQGQSVALSGDGNTAMVGGFDDNGGAGAAWVYTRSNGVWTQQGGKLVGTGASGNAFQGYSVGLSGTGDTAVVGGYTDNSTTGAAWIFTRAAGVWTQQGSKLVPSDAAPPSAFGVSSAISADGNKAILGGHIDNGATGAAWIFTRSAGVWAQQGSKLVGVGGSGTSLQGLAVGLSADGNAAIVGAPGDNNYVGAAWLYGTSSNFGAINVGSNAVATIGVQWPSNFTLGNIRVVIQGTANSDYTLASTQPSSGACTTGTAYGTGNTCSVNIQFSPTAPGPRQGAILFYDNANPANLVATVFISGTGLAAQSAFVSGLIATVAGTGASGYTGDGGLATSATLAGPFGMAVDSVGDLYVSQAANNVVRRVDGTTGIITTVAGNGTYGYNGDGGPATSARLGSITGLAVDGAGNLYIADRSFNVVRMVSAGTGNISTVAGNGTSGYSGDGGQATSAQLNGCFYVAVDGGGNLYIEDNQTDVIREVNAGTGIITTVAGAAGSPGYSGDGGPALGAQMNSPLNIALDAANNLYISDNGNNVIRKVNAFTGDISTVAGNGIEGFSGDGGLATSAELNDPEGLALDSAANMYIADSSNNAMRKVSASTGIIITIGGIGDPDTTGYSGDGGPATLARLNYPVTPGLDGAGNLYIVDNSNNVIRRISGIAPLSFATTTVGSDSAAQDATVTNDGSAAMALSSLTASTNFNLNGSDTTCTATTALNPGDSCVLGVEFAPTAGGSLTGSITLVDNAGTQMVSLSGTGHALTSTTTTLSVSPNPAVAGQTVTFTATVSPTPTGTPTGTVSFYDGATLLGMGTVNSSGVATFITGALPNGADSLTAVYSGNASFATSTSSAVTETVNSTAATTTTLTASPNPAVAGATVTLTAAVSPAPTGSTLGTVSFYDGTTLLGIGMVNSSGVATFTTGALPAGSDSLTAVYSGNTAFAASTSSAVTENVSPLTGTTTTLTASPSPAVFDQAVVLTATVSPAPTGSTPGTVDFYDGATLLGSATVNSSGVATLTISDLPTGALSLTAVYSGNAAFAASTSVVFAETVNTTYTVTAPPAPIAVPEGGSVQVTVTVPPLGGTFDSVVTMSASGLPPGATASFNPPTVTPGSTGAPTVMTIQLAALTAGMVDRNFPHRNLPFASFAFATGLCGIGFRRKRFSRRVKRVLASAVLACMAFTLVACGGGFIGPPTTQPGSYVVTVTGTSGSAHVSTTVTVVVQ